MINKLGARTSFVFADGGLTEAVEFIQRTPRIWRQNASEKLPAQSWDFNVGWEGALKMASQGWHDGVVQIDAAVKLLPVQGRSISTGYDVAGEFPDVSRYCAGDPNHMHVRRKQPKKPIVHLVVSVACSAVTSAQKFRDFGAAVAYLVDKIENSGRRVELDALMVGEQGGHRRLMGWKVKHAEDPLDLSAIAFSMAHPASFRRLGFALYERTNGEVYGFYSLPVTARKEELAELGMEDAFVIEGVGTAAAEGVRDMLKLVTKRINAAAGETIIEEEK